MRNTPTPRKYFQLAQNILLHPRKLEDFEETTEQECKEMVGDIVSEGDRVKKIVSNLLDFTRESETRLEPLDLAELVRDTIVLAKNQIKVASAPVGP